MFSLTTNNILLCFLKTQWTVTGDMLQKIGLWISNSGFPGVVEYEKTELRADQTQ